MSDEMVNAPLIVYGRRSCGSARWLSEVLDENSIEYEWRDVALGEPHFQNELRALANGNLSVPTVVFGDGTVMVEPRPDKVLAKLRLLEKS